MPQQPDLIGPQPLTVTPAAGLAGPRLWIRRLVIWKEPGGEKVRDVALRPGLNIIWSPDGSDDAASAGQENAIGHGSGKTLFCRLIRYCLGEDRFATETQRDRIGTAFLNGIVGAEVMLDGTCWAIVRPLGARRRHMAVPNGNLDEIAAGEGASTGIEPFVEAVDQNIITPALAELVRPRTDGPTWPVALAWLTRDQECRFDDVLDWRSPTSDSDSPIPASGREKGPRLEALRAFLMAITPEAETVRTIFRLYLEHRNVRRVKEAADRMGLTTKIRMPQGTASSGGRPLSRGYIYKLLGNPLYVGRIAHKGKVYDGQHPAIVDAATWNAVQAGLALKTPGRSSGIGKCEPSSLAGKLFDEAGVRLTPSHAIKSGRRYRYYVSKHLIGDTVAEGIGKKGWRLPAGEIERIVGEAVAGLLADRALLADATRQSGLAAERVNELLSAIAKSSTDVLTLVEGVHLGSGTLSIDLNLSTFVGETEFIIRHEVAAQIRRRGVEMKLVLEDTSDGTAKPRLDPALIKAIARAHAWFDDLLNGRARSFGDLARMCGVSDRYIGHLMPLAFLAPEIVEAIVAGRQPPDVTAETLIKRTDLPLDWVEQKSLLGFA